MHFTGHESLKKEKTELVICLTVPYILKLLLLRFRGKKSIRKKLTFLIIILSNFVQSNRKMYYYCPLI